MNAQLSKSLWVIAIYYDFTIIKLGLIIVKDEE